MLFFQILIHSQMLGYYLITLPSSSFVKGFKPNTTWQTCKDYKNM